MITSIDAYRDGGTITMTYYDNNDMDLDPIEICIDKRINTKTLDSITFGYPGRLGCLPIISKDLIETILNQLIEYDESYNDINKLRQPLIDSAKEVLKSKL